MSVDGPMAPQGYVAGGIFRNFNLKHGNLAYGISTEGLGEGEGDEQGEIGGARSEEEAEEGGWTWTRNTRDRKLLFFFFEYGFIICIPIAGTAPLQGFQS